MRESEFATGDRKQRQPLALGVIGGAQHSAVGYAHYVASRMDNRFQPVAGCFSRSAEQNRESGAFYGVQEHRLYNDWQTLLSEEQGRVDAVVILTPTPAHREMAGACLAADIPVICEKALGCTATETGELLSLCEQNRGFLAVTFNYSGYPMMRELRGRIARGELGKILHFQAEMPQEGYVRTNASGQRPTPQRWRLRDGAVKTLGLDLAVHLHHCIHYLLQARPLSVVADQASEGFFPHVVDDFSCLARYENEIRGQFWFSKASLGHRNGLRLRIYGTQGSAEWFQCNPEELLLCHANGRREIIDRASDVTSAAEGRYSRFKPGHPAGFVEAFANLYADFADALLEHRRSGRWVDERDYGARVAHEGLLMLEAMENSCRTRAWVDVDLPTTSSLHWKPTVRSNYA